MANEITVTASLSASKGGSTVTLAKSSLTFDMTGSRMLHSRVSVGVAEEAIGLSEAGTGGWMCAFNHDATNEVALRQATAAANFFRMKAGEPFLGRLDTAATAPFWIAISGACEVEYVIVED